MVLVGDAMYCDNVQAHTYTSRQAMAVLSVCWLQLGPDRFTWNDLRGAVFPSWVDV